jgi:hypothetical protein
VGAEAAAGLLGGEAAAAAAAMESAPPRDDECEDADKFVMACHHPKIIVASLVGLVFGLTLTLVGLVIRYRRRLMVVQTQLGAATDLHATVPIRPHQSDASDHVKMMLTSDHATAEI